MIQIKNLTKQFGEKCAVNNLSLTIKEGTCFAFLGPNAAGKTTTIKLLTGLLKPTDGDVFIGGYHIQDQYVEAKRLIGYVPDVPYLYEKLTPREHIRFILDLYGKRTAERIELSEQLLVKLKLVECADQLTGDLSHGTRQKVVFVCTFIHDPKVIIVDEPMVGLDPESARLVKNMLKEKLQEGCTVFMSTHTLSDAEELADRIGIIDHGRGIAQGTFDELKQKSGIHGKLEEVFLKITQEEVR
ncbi:MAG: ABC transporter ATP-binding protein [Candidatus Omnitrophica bacterium]|nr:ABC transporter ATP-binding protein [Candidatus Omnitrophota bacterium]